LIVGCTLLGGVIGAIMRCSKETPLRWWEYAAAAVLAVILVYGLSVTPMPP
jgi:membrane protein YdbS with pleckstrin-like domain